MSVLEMYRSFRKHFPELSQAADARHIKLWDSVDDDTAFLWFESLAGALNDQMGAAQEGSDLSSVFSFFERQLQSTDTQVKACIDVSFVENLFWDVPRHSAAAAWNDMPKSLQQLYVGFHGKPPTRD